MTRPTEASLTGHLARALTSLPAAPLVVALSGGPDSTALLHALVAQTPRPSLRALHVDHGLHADSRAWALHCDRLCTALGVKLEIGRVTVDLSRGEGMEASARRARYAAFASSVRPGERLVLAHHRDDQVETVLLKLLRGAGPEGLSGMRPLRALGSGALWRPLLDLPREALLTHVAAHELSTLDDPSNTDPRVARGYLRGTVLPALLERWPQAAASIVHSARLCLEATASLRAVWMESLDALRRDEDTLDAKGWLALTPALRAPLLDHWLHSRGLTAPTTAQREQLERQIHEGAAERLPLVGWLDTEVRVWRGRLWAMRRHAAFDTSWSAMWTGEALRLPGGGTLTLTPGDSRLRQPLRVAYRTGGETLKPQGDRHTRELRDLFQQGGVPPWRRPRMPLLWLNRELVAVGPRWISEQGRRLLEEAGAGLLWNEDD